MKRRFLMKVFISVMMIISLMSMQVSASIDPELQAKSSNALVKLELMRGDQNGDLKLDNKVTRCEFFTMVIRMMGYDKSTSVDDIDLPFTDISKKHWAYNNIKIALKHKLVTGYTDNTIKPDNYVTYTEAQAVLLRALNYESSLEGKWPDNVINKSIELGLNKNIDLPKDKQLSRGETSVLIYNSLTVDFNR